MAEWKQRKFSTLVEHLYQSNDMAGIFGKVNELNRITDLLHQAFPELALICHCGAIDYANDLIVLFTANNSAFYTVNNRVGQIQDLLSSNGVLLNKLLVKVSPQSSVANKPRQKHLVGIAEHEMLAKFAVAINRPDLLKPLADPEDEDSVAVESWQIKL